MAFESHYDGYLLEQLIALAKVLKTKSIYQDPEYRQNDFQILAQGTNNAQMIDGYADGIMDTMGQLKSKNKEQAKIIEQKEEEAKKSKEEAEKNKEEAKKNEEEAKKSKEEAKKSEEALRQKRANYQKSQAQIKYEKVRKKGKKEGDKNKYVSFHIRDEFFTQTKYYANSYVLLERPHQETVQVTELRYIHPNGKTVDIIPFNAGKLSECAQALKATRKKNGISSCMMKAEVEKIIEKHGGILPDPRLVATLSFSEKATTSEASSQPNIGPSNKQ